MSYIYKITNSINDKIYIGKTEHSIEKRFREHCIDAFRERNEMRPLYAAMKKYGIDKFTIQLIEETEQPDEREIYWIQFYNSYEQGYNATLGGDGKRRVDYDKVVELYREVQNKAEVAKIMHIDPGTVTKILEMKNEKTLTSAEVMKNKRGKSVKMLSLDGEFMRVFPSMGEAAIYLIQEGLSNCKKGTIQTHISEVCHGKRKTAAKFKWEFE